MIKSWEGQKNNDNDHFDDGGDVDKEDEEDGSASLNNGNDDFDDDGGVDEEDGSASLMRASYILLTIFHL